MLRYLGAAATLRVLSLPPGPLAYRFLAIQVGGRRRARGEVPTSYLGRANLLLRLIDENGLSASGGRVFELGTGWINWYGTVAALAIGGHADLFDVIDNRQLDAAKHYFASLDQLDFPATSEASVAAVVGAACTARSFTELYSSTDIAYTVDAAGSLARFPADAYDLVVSFHVLEHVQRESAADTISQLGRLLKPGGLSIHQIGIDDHLAHYDRRAHPKQYLSISPAMWSRRFENQLQYFNRLQLSEWQQLFKGCGFTAVEVVAERCDMGNLNVASEYRCLSDLDVTIVTFVHRRV